MPTSLDALLDAFADGFEPNLSNVPERQAFDVYRRSRFGNPATSLNADTFDRMAEWQLHNPDIRKPLVPEVLVARPTIVYPGTDGVPAFKKLTTLYASLRESQKAVEKALNGEKAFLITPQRLTEADFAAMFEAPLGQRFDHGPDIGMAERLSALWRNAGNRLLEKEALKEDTKYLRTLLVDIATTYGFFLASPDELLKDRSVDAMRKLAAIENAFIMRVDFLANHGRFERADQKLEVFTLTDLYKNTRVQKPSRLPAESVLQATLAEVRVAIEALGTPGEPTTSRFRPLSQTESPARSQLGGGDCSSRTYLTRGFDPNMIYITETDAAGHSSGHLTIALGTAEEDAPVVEGQPPAPPRHLRAAMVDKVQNVPNDRLEEMLEGARMALLSLGYELGIPDDRGDQNGISNDQRTRDFIGSSVAAHTQSTRVLKNFTPHPHTLLLDSAYSRAYDKLSVKILLPLGQVRPKHPTTLTLGKARAPFRFTDFDLSQTFAEIVALKGGDLESRLRYIRSIGTFAADGLVIDPQFELVAGQWLREEATPASLKFAILRTLFEANREDDQHWGRLQRPEPLALVAGLAESLTLAERETVAQNWMQVTTLKAHIQRSYYELGALIGPLVRRDPSLLHQGYGGRFEVAHESMRALWRVSDPYAGEFEAYVLKRAKNGESPELLRYILQEAVPRAERRLAGSGAELRTQAVNGFQRQVGEDYRQRDEVLRSMQKLVGHEPELRAALDEAVVQVLQRQLQQRRYGGPAEPRSEEAADGVYVVVAHGRMYVFRGSVHLATLPNAVAVGRMITFDTYTFTADPEVPIQHMYGSRGEWGSQLDDLARLWKADKKGVASAWIAQATAEELRRLVEHEELQHRIPTFERAIEFVGSSKMPENSPPLRAALKFVHDTLQGHTAAVDMFSTGAGQDLMAALMRITVTNVGLTEHFAVIPEHERLREEWGIEPEEMDLIAPFFLSGRTEMDSAERAVMEKAILHHGRSAIEASTTSLELVTATQASVHQFMAASILWQQRVPRRRTRLEEGLERARDAGIRLRTTQLPALQKLFGTCGAILATYPAE